MPGKGLPTSVLVADDEPDMRTLVRVVIELADHGLSLHGEAADGLEALELWGGGGTSHPDVVILDNRMPGVSGMSVARVILDRRPQQPIVLFSAFLDDQVRAEAAAVGIGACVSKEDVHTLPDVIWELIDQPA